MILIFSKDRVDITTSDVIRWLKYFETKYLRVNGEDYRGKVKFNIDISNDCEDGYIKSNLKFYKLSDVDVVWYRREGDRSWVDLSEINEFTLRSEIDKHIRNEVSCATSALYYFLRHANWLSHPSTSKINKIEQLVIAKEKGLNIPISKLTNSKDELINMIALKENLIIKSIYNSISLIIKGKSYNSYTAKLYKNHIMSLPEIFFPCLVQEYVEKKFELRIFYLNNKCYTMAIFSQKDSQTLVDFRNYNWSSPNRTVPYQLPVEIEKKIQSLMTEMKLETGSIDMIRSKNDKYIFLEVNPVGQLGMTSLPCNYNLEKIIAENLLERVNNGN